jgi:Zn-dependent protease
MQGPFQNRQTFSQRVKQMLAPVLVALAAGGKMILSGLPLLKMFGTMIIAFGFYAVAFGWWFALGFILLIFIHEMGHVIAARMVGLKVSLPYFIPFMGAVIMLREAPRNAWIEAIIGIGGPLLGSLGALGVASCYFLTGHQIFLALGYFGFLINLFNLVPMVPFDGGRIVTAISPWLWLIGLAILIPYLIFLAFSGSVIAAIFTVFVLFMLYRNFPRVIALFRGRNPAQARYYECTPDQRWTMGLLYFSLAASLYMGMTFIKSLLPPGSF